MSAKIITNHVLVVFCLDQKSNCCGWMKRSVNVEVRGRRREERVLMIINLVIIMIIIFIGGSTQYAWEWNKGEWRGGTPRSLTWVEAETIPQYEGFFLSFFFGFLFSF